MLADHRGRARGRREGRSGKSDNDENDDEKTRTRIIDDDEGPKQLRATTTTGQRSAVLGAPHEYDGAPL